LWEYSRYRRSAKRSLNVCVMQASIPIGQGNFLPGLVHSK
jgi:hypothetical protein